MRIFSGGGGFPWVKWLLVLALIAGGYTVVHKRGWMNEDFGSIASRLWRSDGPEPLAALAAGTQAGEVFIFSAAWCPYCREAKRWMDEHGFPYEQCDIDKDHGCRARLSRLASDGGVPYLIVRGHHMKDGFDSEEFLAALRKGAAARSEKQK